MGLTAQIRLRWLRQGLILACFCAALVGANAIAPTVSSQSQVKMPDYKNPRLPVERRVADLLSRMTLEEKVAQLVCLWTDKPQVNPQTDFSTTRGDLSRDIASGRSCSTAVVKSADRIAIDAARTRTVTTNCGLSGKPSVSALTMCAIAGP